MIHQLFGIQLKVNVLLFAVPVNSGMLLFRNARIALLIVHYALIRRTVLAAVMDIFGTILFKAAFLLMLTAQYIKIYIYFMKIFLKAN